MKRSEGVRRAAGWGAGLATAVGVAAGTGCTTSTNATGPAAGDASTDTAPEPDDSGTASNDACHATIAQGALAGRSVGATCEYLGIPYGAPPVGALRFAPAQPAAGWPGVVRDATKFGPTCIPSAPSPLGGPASEDCLFVNVFGPKTAPSAALPVMVFIHGGGFNGGAGSQYDARALAERGPVVVVTMNYRLGPLGFLALPGLDAQRAGVPSGSDGIRDQQLALTWVKDNASVFHGDPTNVTVFGESAGSISTCLHLVSPGSQGLARRFIMESGSCVAPPGVIPDRAHGYAVSELLASAFCANGASADAGAGADAEADAGASADAGAGADAETDAGADADPDTDAAGAIDPVACLRAADPVALMAWAPAADAGVVTPLGSVFFPIVDGPGGVLPDLPQNLIASGQYDKTAAILAGSNLNEWGLFVELASDPTFGGVTTSPLNITTVAALNQFIETSFGSFADPVKLQYPAASDAVAMEVYVTLATDFGYRCPMRDLARAVRANGTSDFFLYSYDVGRAYHSDELLALFDVAGLSLLGGTVPSAGFQSQMKGYWTQFAASGTPNAAPDGGTDAGVATWPLYAADSDEHLVLSDPTPAAAANLQKANCDFWDTYEASLTP